MNPQCTKLKKSSLQSWTAGDSGSMRQSQIISLVAWIALLDKEIGHFLLAFFVITQQPQSEYTSCVN